jgi:hypothetical protein
MNRGCVRRHTDPLSIFDDQVSSKRSRLAYFFPASTPFAWNTPVAMAAKGHGQIGRQPVSKEGLNFTLSRN